MKNKSQNVNVGSSSILMIFVVLCLICFATLSIVSAKSDDKLSRKFAEKTTAYYSACNLAEGYLSSIDTSLKEAADTLSESAYFDAVGQSISFYIPINDLQSLYIDVSPLYPSKEGEFYYSLTHYKVVNINPMEPDNSLNMLIP